MTDGGKNKAPTLALSSYLPFFILRNCIVLLRKCLAGFYFLQLPFYQQMGDYGGGIGGGKIDKQLPQFLFRNIYTIQQLQQAVKMMVDEFIYRIFQLCLPWCRLHHFCLLLGEHHFNICGIFILVHANDKKGTDCLAQP